ncbi:MAG: N-acetylmuramoyl-L-alanine amidase [Candidatus Sericytochromatia bacterium]
MKRLSVQGAPFYRIEAADIRAELPKLFPAGTARYITLHWTAGGYNVPFSDYQILIGHEYILISEDMLNWSRHQHSWRRNTGNIGISFMAMANATERNAGPAPVTKPMIEHCALVAALIVRRYALDWFALVDHAHWAALDGYPGQRWDCQWPVPWEHGEHLTDVVKRKAKWYHEKSKSLAGP